MSGGTGKHPLGVKRALWFLLFLTLTVLWTHVIFGFSSESGKESSSKSQAITEKVIRVIDKDYKMPEKIQPKSIDSIYDNITRKSAHIFSYCLLGFLMCMTVKCAFGAEKCKKLSSCIAIILCVTTACFDEYNQTLTEGRMGRITDVFIDGAGILIGVTVCYFLIKKVYERKRAG